MVKVRAVYTTNVDNMCEKCCYNEICTQDGYCKCDEYRETHNKFNVEGDYYFIEIKKRQPK